MNGFDRINSKPDYFDVIGESEFKFGTGLFDRKGIGLALMARQETGIDLAHGFTQDTLKMHNPLKPKYETEAKPFNFNSRLSLDSKIPEAFQFSLSDRFKTVSIPKDKKSNPVDIPENKTIQNLDAQISKDDSQLDRVKTKNESQKIQLFTPNNSSVPNKNRDKKLDFRTSSKKKENFSTESENCAGFEESLALNNMKKENILKKSETVLSPVGKKNFLLMSKKRQEKNPLNFHRQADSDEMDHEACLKSLLDLKNNIERLDSYDFQAAVTRGYNIARIQKELPERILNSSRVYYRSLKKIEAVLSSEVPEIQEIADFLMKDIQESLKMDPE